MVLKVEVFPVEPYRWIAVIEAPRGPFSTETTRASDVLREVTASIESVLGTPLPAIELVDDRGEPWSPAVASAQVERLEIAFDEQVQIPVRQPWWKRLLGYRPAWFGDCPACGHDWREHVPSEASAASAASVGTRSSTKSQERRRLLAA